MVTPCKPLQIVSTGSSKVGDESWGLYGFHVTCLYVGVYVYTHTFFVSLLMLFSTFTCMYVYIHIGMYVFTHMYTYVFKEPHIKEGTRRLCFSAGGGEPLGCCASGGCWVLKPKL